MTRFWRVSIGAAASVVLVASVATGQAAATPAPAATDSAANPISRWLGRGPGGAMLRQNADGSYMNPWSVNWVDNTGKQRTDPLDINCKCFDPEKTVVLNSAAWQAVEILRGLALMWMKRISVTTKK